MRRSDGTDGDSEAACVNSRLPAHPGMPYLRQPFRPSIFPARRDGLRLCSTAQVEDMDRLGYTVRTQETSPHNAFVNSFNQWTHGEFLVVRSAAAVCRFCVRRSPKQSSLPSAMQSTSWKSSECHHTTLICMQIKHFAMHSVWLHCAIRPVLAID